MKILAAMFLLFLSTGCFAPSLTIYGRGTTIGADGVERTVAIKEVQAYGDFLGALDIKGSLVSVSSSGGYLNSTVVRENWAGLSEFGRAVVQPIIWGLVTAGVLGNVTSDVTGAATTIAQ